MRNIREVFKHKLNTFLLGHNSTLRENMFKYIYNSGILTTEFVFPVTPLDTDQMFYCIQQEMNNEQA